MALQKLGQTVRTDGADKGEGFTAHTARFVGVFGSSPVVIFKQSLQQLPLTEEPLKPLVSGSADTAALIQLVNAELANHGTEFLSAVESAVGPFGTSVRVSIEGHPVRLDFVSNPGNDRRAVNFFNLRTNHVLGGAVGRLDL